MAATRDEVTLDTGKFSGGWVPRYKLTIFQAVQYENVISSKEMEQLVHASLVLLSCCKFLDSDQPHAS